MADPTHEPNATLALTRFGMGAGPGDLSRVASDPAAWLAAQIDAGAPGLDGDLDTGRERIERFNAYQAQGAPRDDATREARQTRRRAIVQDTNQEFLARTRLAAETDRGFAERWALFWSNWFTVSAVKFNSGAFVGPFEREAIRPHVFGRFEDLTLAAEQHPAMLMYLDQARSAGPNSRAGTRRRVGLNENLAREILELHTVGTDGGYSQADVTEFARALTGWTVPRRTDDRVEDATFVFRPAVHEPGDRVVMGKTYPAGGVDQGRAVLRDLANYPQTAKRAARRIAAHFVADDPPPALVARLEQAWKDSGGALDVVARALIAAAEAWTPTPAKIKTPYEFVVSAYRALGLAPRNARSLRQDLVALGQTPFSPPSPEGWPDTAADWAGPDAMVKRLDWSRRTAARAEATISDPVATAEAALGARLGPRTRTAVARAESRGEALTLLLMSPEFQRR